MKITEPYFCIAMFVAMCGRCTLKFEVFYRTAFTGRAKLLEDIEFKPKQVCNQF